VRLRSSGQHGLRTFDSHTGLHFVPALIAGEELLRQLFTLVTAGSMPITKLVGAKPVPL